MVGSRGSQIPAPVMVPPPGGLLADLRWKLREVPKQLAYGLPQGFVELLQTLEDVDPEQRYRLLKEIGFDDASAREIAERGKQALRDLEIGEQPRTVAGGLARGAAQMVPTGLLASQAAPGILGGMIGGAVADFATIDPRQGRLAGILDKATKGKIPGLGALAHNELAEGGKYTPGAALRERAKNVVEGAVLGVATEGAIKAGKAAIRKGEELAGDAARRMARSVAEAPIPRTVELRSLAPGLAAGVEYDEDTGQLTIDPRKVMYGMAGALLLAQGAALMRPRIRRFMGKTKVDFEYLDPAPQVPRSAGGKKIFKLNAENPLNRNERIQEVLGAVVNRGGYVPLDEFERAFRQNLVRDEAGLTVFDRIWGSAWEQRASQLSKEDYKLYGRYDREGVWHPIEDNIEQIETGSNRKTAGEVREGDTSKGCIGNCLDCYALACSHSPKKHFAKPRAVVLKGRFEEAIKKNPDVVFRFGTSGDPNLDPWKWLGYEQAVEELAKQGKTIPAERLNAIIDDVYDWSWTVQQLKDAGLDAGTVVTLPDGRRVSGADRTFLITKLQSLKGFDPTVLRHLEVSIDPLNPDHFFRALRNVAEIKRRWPDVDIKLRVRSLHTYNDEINALQWYAVKFAKEHRIPILETRIRFKNKESMALVGAAPDYSSWQTGGQHVPVDKIWKSKPTVTSGKWLGDKENSIFSRQLGALTEKGVRKYDVFAEFDAPKAKTLRFEKKEGKWHVYDAEGKLLATGKKDEVADLKKQLVPAWRVRVGDRVVRAGLTKDEAFELAQKTAIQKYGPPVTTERAEELARTTSPLSRFGIPEDLLYICDKVNSGGCGTCQNCRAFLEASLKE